MSNTSNHNLVGVILSAGKGVRAYPSTKYTPKVLLKIDGKTLIERNIEIMRDQLHIEEIVVVVGHMGDQIINFFDRRDDLGVRLTFIRQENQNGIGDALLKTEDYLQGRTFLVVLGDELYLGSNHSKLLDYMDREFSGVLTFREEADPEKVSKNFVANFDNGRVLSLIEKPKYPVDTIMGLGTYLLTSNVFKYLKDTDKSSLRGEVEITDALSNMAKKETVLACTLDGEYINITTRENVNSANYHVRNSKFDSYIITIVIPAYNEEETIAKVINDFKSVPRINEVLVVNNNSSDNTHMIAEEAGARVVVETKQGYGCALKRGINEAQGDIIVLTEADGTFLAKDLYKLLEYLKDCDMAIGTRTTRQMIEQGANMDGITRWANIFFGKFIELLWWGQEPRFTDVGCTYRALWKTSYRDIEPYLNASGPEFSTEMMVAMLIARKRIIEVPVSYYKRIGGTSAHSINYYAKMKTALRMLRTCLKRRFMH